MEPRANAFIRLWLALLVVAGTHRAAAQTAAGASPAGRPPAVEGTFSLGGTVTSNTGNQNRVGEYDLLSNGGLPGARADLHAARGRTLVDLAAAWGGEVHYQAYDGRLDVGRALTVDVRYTRFPHRLDHDPLGYIDAASGIGGTFVVRHTDTDPGAAHRLDYGALEAQVNVTIPRVPFVKLFVSGHQQVRQGHRQVLVTNHCATCHVVGYTRGLDQRAREVAAGARVLARALTLDYRFERRSFDERAGSLVHVYDRAVHPATLADVFYNRVQFDARNGPLPIDAVPAGTQQTHSLRARLELPRAMEVSGQAVHATTRNTDQDLAARYTGGAGRFVVPLGARLTLTGALRRYRLDADSVFVEVADTVAPAGPTAGLTYEQAYPGVGELSYLRESVRARQPTDLSLELAFRPRPHTSLRVGYAWASVERDHFDVAKTTTDTVRAAGRGRFGKALTWQFRADREWTTDPFAYERAAIPQVLQPYPSPGNLPFTGLQYFAMYRSRQATLTSFPTDATRADTSWSWTPGPRVSLAGHLRYQGASNDQLNWSTWRRAAYTPGAEVWIAGGDRWSLAAGYTYQRERLETLFSTLAFVG